MRKEILVENCLNASKEYSNLQAALMEAFEGDAIMSCLIGNLNRMAEEYYKSILDVYQSGYTMDEILSITGEKREKNGEI